MDLRKLSTLYLFTNQGRCTIQLLAGDLTRASAEEKVDILVVTTLPRFFSIKTEPLMEALRKNMNISIDQLSRDMDKDLRKDYGCWVSKTLPKNLPFRRLACFEKQADSRKPSNAIRKMFRAFTPIFDSQDTTVMTNLLGTWNQQFDHVQVLNMTVNAACNWMMIGLPLKCLKIVLCEHDGTESKNNPSDFEDCIKEFERLKEIWTTPKTVRFSIIYDVYISHSPQDEQKADILASKLIQANENLKICYTPQIKSKKAWPKEAMFDIYSCKRFIPLLTSYYLQNKDCIDEFMTAVCYQNQDKYLELIPLLLGTFRSLPPVIRNYPFLDCRINSWFAEQKSLCDKFTNACKNITRNLTLNTLRSEPHSECHDIYISYPDKYWKEAETVFKIVKRHNPKLNIFYDKLGDCNLSHSIYKVLEEVRCCIFLVTHEYFESFICKEEFNAVVARRLFDESKKEMAVIPLCISDVFIIPDWFGQLNIFDARDSLFHPTIQMLAAKLNSSFSNNTLNKDFDWLMEKEISKHLCLKRKLSNYRLCQFRDDFFVHEATVTPRIQPGHLFGPCSILVCFSNYDRRIAGLLTNILRKEIPLIDVMLLNKPDKDSFYQLNKADHIVMFVCEDFLTSPKGLEVLFICLERQRKSKRRILHFACTSLIPSCLSYLKILPYSILFTDQIWWDMRLRYPGKDYITVSERGVNGKFSCETFEYMAFEKLVYDIMISEQVECSSPDQVENLVPILKIIQEIPDFFTLDDLLVPCPWEYNNLCCLQESLRDETEQENQSTTD